MHNRGLNTYSWWRFIRETVDTFGPIIYLAMFCAIGCAVMLVTYLIQHPAYPAGLVSGMILIYWISRHRSKGGRS